MNEDIKDILLELEDEGYTISYRINRFSDNGSEYSIEIQKYPFKVKMKDIKDILLRLFYYKNQKDIYFDVTTKNRIMGARLYNNGFGDTFNPSEFKYRVDIDTSFFDGLYTERARGNNNYNPLYIKNSTEIKKVEIILV